MRHVIVFLFGAAALYATPQLRLSTSTVGPLNIAVGQNGVTQTASATNIGDGTLVLSASANVPWITANIVGTNVQIALSTATLAQGIATGLVTVTAANAIDSPQTIAVTVQMGGGVPNSINFYMPPGGAASTTFIASNTLNASASPPPGGLTLAILAQGGGSFATTGSYQVTATSPATTAPETSYNGRINVISSGFQPDVKSVPVTINVTNKPIGALVQSSLQFNVAQGAAPVTKWIQLANQGASALAITGATVSTSAAGGAAWLTTQISGTTVVATGDPTGLSPGKYTAAISIAGTAVNGPFTVPVEMDVVAVGPPVSYFQGVADNAVYAQGATVAPGEWVLVRGEQFTTGAPAIASALPIATALGGATVYVNGVAAPLYYTAASNVVVGGGQITFQVPYNTPSGQATVRVDRNDSGTVQTGNTISVAVQSVAPRLLQFALNGTQYANAQNYTDNGAFPIPVAAAAAVGVAGQPAKAGDLLVFWGYGFGQTSPPVTEGIAVPGLANVPNCLMVFGASALPGLEVVSTPSYCGLSPGLVGVYQVNVTVPSGTPRGDAVPVFLQIGSVISNSVAIAVQ
jgi:uncharacterized protein (TIGR03437 family)